jgi:hypothetical protein
MGKLPGKFLFCFILYAAGFVTAVYFLVPAPALAADQIQVAKSDSQLQSDQPAADIMGIDSKVWIMKIRTGIDTSIHFAEENAVRVADFIRSKMAQGSNSSNGQSVVE